MRHIEKRAKERPEKKMKAKISCVPVLEEEKLGIHDCTHCWLWFFFLSELSFVAMISWW
jgi:hypothetical protein